MLWATGSVKWGRLQSGDLGGECMLRCVKQLILLDLWEGMPRPLSLYFLRGYPTFIMILRVF